VARTGRLRAGTLWALFVVALLAGAAAGWVVRSCSTRTLEERAHEAADEVKSKVEKMTR
jgi:hypothetical protein